MAVACVTATAGEVFGQRWAPDRQAVRTGKNIAPTAHAGGNVSGVVGEHMKLDGSRSYDPHAWITKYAWDFGDGSTGRGRVTTHVYNAAGAYTVTLHVTDNGQRVCQSHSIAPISECVDCSGNDVGSVPARGQEVADVEIRLTLPEPLAFAGDRLVKGVYVRRGDTLGKMGKIKFDLIEARVIIGSKSGAPNSQARWDLRVTRACRQHTLRSVFARCAQSRTRVICDHM